MDMSTMSAAPALTASNLATAQPTPTRVGESASTAPRSQERVDPVDPTQLPAPIKGLGIAPLDLFQVGDNDDVPLPPEPPRDPIAMVAPLEFVEDRPVDQQNKVDATTAPRPETAMAEGDAPREAAPELARAVQSMDDEPRAPSFDIRR